MVLGPILVAPESRGQIRLRSADPHAKPVIEPRYLSDPGGVDRAAMMEGLRICARMAEAPALKDLLGPIARPRDCTELNEATLERALATCAHTLYHPLGTCRMGSDAGECGGSAAAGPRGRGSAGGRRLGDAQHGTWAHACAVGADRGEGRRLDP